MLSLKKFFKKIIKSIIRILIIKKDSKNKTLIRDNYEFIPNYSYTESNKSSDFPKLIFSSATTGNQLFCFMTENIPLRFSKSSRPISIHAK